MSYKLIYFPVRGRATVIRYICSENNAHLEHQLITFDSWTRLKPQMIFHQLPVFIDGVTELAQSNAIVRYLARKYGLYGDNDQQAAYIDMLNDQQDDIRLQYQRLIYQEYETGKNAYVASIPEKFAPFEKMLSKNKEGKEFFVGDKISFADYAIFDLMEIHLVLAPKSMDQFPLLRAFYDRMLKRDGIVRCRETEFFKRLPLNTNLKW